MNIFFDISHCLYLFFFLPAAIFEISIFLRVFHFLFVLLRALSRRGEPFPLLLTGLLSGGSAPIWDPLSIRSSMEHQGRLLLTTCWCGAPGSAVQTGQRLFGAVYVFFSGCRAAPAVKLRVRPTRSPAGGGRERAGGGRGGWWRGWWFGSRLRGVQGLCVPADLLATGNVILGCGFPTFASFGSGEVSRLRISFPSAFSASATQYPVMLPL